MQIRLQGVQVEQFKQFYSEPPQVESQFMKRKNTQKIITRIKIRLLIIKLKKFTLLFKLLKFF